MPLKNELSLTHEYFLTNSFLRVGNIATPPNAVEPKYKHFIKKCKGVGQELIIFFI